MNSELKNNKTTLNSLLYSFQQKFEYLMNEEFDCKKYLIEFRNLVKSSPLILNENQEQEIYSYFELTLDQFHSIKNKLLNHLNKLIKDIINLDIQFVININEISSNLKQYTLNTREIYKKINNEQTSILNDNLIIFYNNCKDIVKRIKEVHTISKNKNINKIGLINSHSQKSYHSIKKKINIGAEKNEKNENKINNLNKTNINKKVFTSPDFQKIILSFHNNSNNNMNNLKRVSSSLIKKNNENSRNKFQNTEIYQTNTFNINNSINTNNINLAYLLKDFLKDMKNLQDAIIKKDKNVHQMKINFEKKKSKIYSLSENIINNNSFELKHYPYSINEQNLKLDLIDENKSQIKELKSQLSESIKQNNKLNQELNEMNQNLLNILKTLKEELIFSLNNSLNNSQNISNNNLNAPLLIDDLIKSNNSYYKDIINYIYQLKEKFKSDKNYKEIYTLLNDVQKIVEEKTNINSDNNSEVNIITGSNNQIINLLDESNTLISKKSSNFSNITYNSVIALIDKIKKNIIEKKEETKKLNDELFELKVKLENKNVINKNNNSFMELLNGFGGRSFTFQSNNDYNNVNNSKDNK